jgi:L-ascorbate metabolism protein UlaG (beta-lactamase superfamily)
MEHSATGQDRIWEEKSMDDFVGWTILARGRSVPSNQISHALLQPHDAMNRILRPSFAVLAAILALLPSLNLLAAEDAPRLTRVETTTNLEVRITATFPAGGHCRYEISPDLLTWLPLVTASNTPSWDFTDTGAPFVSRRYYRAVRLDQATSLTGDHVATDDGDVVIHPINHASLVLGWNGRLISSDPRTASRYQGIPSADLILLTHTHTDHLDTTAIAAVKAANAVILAPPLVYAALPANLKQLTTTLTNGTSTNVSGVLVEAIPAYNTTSTQHIPGAGNGYVLTLGGRRIYISGDTEDIPEMRSLPDIDIAFLCMNRPYTMTVSQAVSAVRQFLPRVVYPFHYQGNPATDLNAFKQQVGTSSGVEVRLRNWY